VDFYWFDSDNLPGLVHVSWDLNDESTKKREIKAIIQDMDETKLESATIVTKNQSATIKVGDKEIKVVPSWHFLINK